MVTPLKPQELKLWLAFLHTSHTIKQQLAEDMQRINRISIGWYDVLVNLYHSPDERLRMQDLAERVLMSGSGLTRLLDRMTAKDLVTRELCADDRRVIYAVLTNKGRARIEELLPQHQQRIHDCFIRHLSDEEIETITPALERILAAVATDP